MENQLKSMLHKALEEEVKREFDSLKEKLLKDLESRKNEICAGILLSVMKTVDMRTIGETITFTIREIK